MPSPFPGIASYLEEPVIWPDFRARLAHCISDELNGALPSPYSVRLDKWLELGILTDPQGHMSVEVRDAKRGHQLITLKVGVLPPNSMSHAIAKTSQ